jgi:hypothetical protein
MTDSLDVSYFGNPPEFIGAVTFDSLDISYNGSPVLVVEYSGGSPPVPPAANVNICQQYFLG